MSRFTAASNFRRRVGLAVAVLGVLSATFAARYQHHDDQARIDARLGQDLQLIREQISDRVRVFEYGLRGARGALIVAGGESFKRDHFLKYAQSRDLHREFPGALGIGFARRVPRPLEAEFVAATRADGLPAFALHELAPHTGERLVIQHIEPLLVNLPALGQDLASDERQRTAAWQAAKSDETTLTPPIELPQVRQGSRLGQRMFLPVYRTDPLPATQAEREAQVFGWVYTPFRSTSSWTPSTAPPQRSRWRSATRRMRGKRRSTCTARRTRPAGTTKEPAPSS